MSYLKYLVLQDDIGEYVDWKSLIKRTEVPGTEEKEKKERKNLAFANILIKGAGIKKVKAKAKFKIPISKEIEIINKWKDLDKADRELASARKHYKVLQVNLCSQSIYISYVNMYIICRKQSKL